MMGFAIGAIMVLACGLCAATITEANGWNGGICRSTGEAWEYFDRSSQGCRGYVSGEHYLFVSFPWIDRPYKKESFK